MNLGQLEPFRTPSEEDDHAGADKEIEIIYGPTAVGKTAHALKIAAARNSVIVNADAMQVYKEFPILSARPTAEEMSMVEHIMYGYKTCLEDYSVGTWLGDVSKYIKTVKDPDKAIILVGGSGMYINALIYGISDIPAVPSEIKEKVRTLSDIEVSEQLKELDPVSDGKLDKNDAVRRRRALSVVMHTDKPIWHFHNKTSNHLGGCKFNITIMQTQMDTLYKKIDQRFIEMIDKGAIDEVAGMKEKLKTTYPKIHGLPHILSYLNGEIKYDTMVEKSQKDVRNYAKRQMTWIRNKLHENYKVKIKIYLA